jgi:hypothetical protein
LRASGTACSAHSRIFLGGRSSVAGWTGTNDPDRSSPLSSASSAVPTISHSCTARPFGLRFPVIRIVAPFSSFDDTHGWLNQVARTLPVSSATFTPTMVNLPLRKGRGGLPITVTRTVPVSPGCSASSNRICRSRWECGKR